MADNTQLNSGTGGDLIATDELATLNGEAAPAGLKAQRVKVGFGADGQLQDVHEGAPLPVAAYGELLEAIEALRMAVHSLTRSIGMSMPDQAGRLRVNAEAGTLVATQATAANLQMTASLAANQVLGTLNNQVSIGAISATEQVPSLMRVAADSLRRNITVN